MVGAAVVVAAGASKQFKDLKMEAVGGKATFTGTSAWVIIGLIIGTLSGLLGLGGAFTAKKLSGKRIG